MKKTFLFIAILLLSVSSWAVHVAYTKKVNAIVIYRFFKADKQRNLYMLFSADLYLDNKFYPIGNVECLENYNYVRYNKRKCRCVNELYTKKSASIFSTEYFGSVSRYDTVDLIHHKGGQIFRELSDTADTAFYIAYKVKGNFAIVDDLYQDCIYPLLCSPRGSYKSAEKLPIFALKIEEFAPLSKDEMRRLNFQHIENFEFTYFISD